MKENTKYLLRFDDIYPNMNWCIWEKIEEILERYDLKPILAVIPDNTDTNLFQGNTNPYFWSNVAKWQQKGYAIALHGLNHVYCNDKAGMLGITRGSEFVGLSRDVQADKILKGKKIFACNGIEVDLWIAPSHSFDEVTIETLKELGITTISDGFMSKAVKYRGITWVPTQLWDRFVKKRSGLWTICYHPNTWGENELKIFEQDIMNYHAAVTNLNDVINDDIPQITLLQRLRHYQSVFKFKIKFIIKRLIRIK